MSETEPNQKDPPKQDSVSILSFRPSYLSASKDVAKPKVVPETSEPEQSSSPNRFSSLNMFSNLPINTIEEKPTNVEQCVYTKKYLIGLRPPMTMQPSEGVVTMMKELEIWLEDDSISDSKRSLIRGKWDPIVKRPNNPKDKLEQFRSDIQLLLNKLTVEKFNPISEKLIDIIQKIEDYNLMVEAVTLIHNTVVIEYRFVSMYADLCKLISPKCKQVIAPETGKAATFRQLMLNKCQKMFEVSTIPVTFSEQPDVEKRNKENHYALGNILFLGELFNRNLVPAHITEAILNLLLQKIMEGLNIEPEKGKLQTEGCCEKLCRLFCCVGKNLDLNYKTKPAVDKLVNDIKALMRSAKLPMRLNFMLSDLVDLKQNNWIPRKSVEFQNANLLVPSTLIETKPTLTEPTAPVSSPTANNVNNIDAPKVIVSRKIIGESNVSKSSNSILEKNIEEMIEYYLLKSSNISSALEFCANIQNGGLHQLVYHSIVYALEKNTLERLQILELLVKFSVMGALTSESLEIGIKNVINILPDLYQEYPLAYVYVGQVLSETISKKCISLDNVREGVNATEFNKLKIQ
jgi:translation initiation factor 4G